MRLQKQALVAVLGGLLLGGCGKDKLGETADAKDTAAPAVLINSPLTTDRVTAGQTISVKATATDNVKVTELHIHVTNKENGNLLRDIHSYPATATGTVQDAFTAQVATVYVIKIIALDAAQNLTTAQVEVAVQ